MVNVRLVATNVYSADAKVPAKVSASAINVSVSAINVSASAITNVYSADANVYSVTLYSPYGEYIDSDS